MTNRRLIHPLRKIAQLIDYFNMRPYTPDMSEEANAIRNYFVDLGLDLDIAELYLALRTYGPQSLMQLSRNSGIERRRIYRLLDSLSSEGLIEIEEMYKRKLYKASPIANLQIVLTKKEEELSALQEKFKLLDTLLAEGAPRSPVTRVQFYKGTDGIKQMMWNETKGTTENLSILYENMQGRTNSAFFNRWVEKCNKHRIKFRGIIGDHFVETQKLWYKTHHNDRIAQWESRYFPTSTMPITHSTVIYDDVIAYYNWVNNEVFGIELYNEEIANHQRQLFEMLWEKAQPVNDLKGP
jgi:hypothetical protein